MEGAKDIKVGDRFGSLTVVRLVRASGLSHVQSTIVKCVCGRRMYRSRWGLARARNVGTDSGLACPTCRYHRNSEFGIWSAMKSRCANPKVKNYGARGITVCERWLESFDNFIADMGKRPSRGHSIDRIDVNGNYEPGNCRWATKFQQARNRRSNRPITVDGRTMLLVEWANEAGLAPAVIAGRLHRGWSPERAVATPIRKGASK